MATRKRGTSVETESANEAVQDVTSETSRPSETDGPRDATAGEGAAAEGTGKKRRSYTRRAGAGSGRSKTPARFVATIEVQTTAEGLNDLSAIVESLSSDTSSASIKGIRPSK